MDKNSTDRMVTKEKTIKVVFRKFETEKSLAYSQKYLEILATDADLQKN